MPSSTPSPCCRLPLEPLLLPPLRLPHHQPPRTHSQPARCPLSLSATPRKLTGLSHQLHGPWDYQHAAGVFPSCTRTLYSFSLCTTMCSMPAHCRVLLSARTPPLPVCPSAPHASWQVPLMAGQPGPESTDREAAQPAAAGAGAGEEPGSSLAAEERVKQEKRQRQAAVMAQFMAK